MEVQHQYKIRYYQELISDFKQSIQILLEDYVNGKEKHT